MKSKPFFGQERNKMSEIESNNKSGIEVGYKVFSGKKALKPATSAALQRIRYNPGQWVKQAGDHGPFAVFDNLDAAKKFKEQGYGTQIRQVEYIPSNESALWKKLPPDFSRNRWGTGYHAVSVGITERSISECPEGTRLASEVFVHTEVIE
jgi:hypothetical protein